MIHRIERLNYILGVALAAGAAVTQPHHIAYSVAVGVALTCLNFFVLRKLVVRWTRDTQVGQSGKAPYLMLPKMIGLMALVAVAILVLRVDPIAFTIGYSTFMFSILIATLIPAIRQRETTTENRDG